MAQYFCALMNRKSTRSELLPVELVRNKASDKYFIVLDDTGGVDFLLITPEGKVGQFERCLFGPLDIVDPKKLRWRHRLTELQLKKYEESFDR